MDFFNKDGFVSNWPITDTYGYILEKLILWWSITIGQLDNSCFAYKKIGVAYTKAWRV